MSDQQDNQQSDHLDQVNVELTRSLRACHSIIDDYRSKFAANLNDPVPANEGENLEQGDDDSRLG